MPLTEHLSWEVVSEGEGKASWNAKKKNVLSLRKIDICKIHGSHTLEENVNYTSHCKVEYNSC